MVKETKGKEKVYNLEYGFLKISLPGHKKPLYLLVVRGFGEDPLMLLTSIELRKKRSLLWWVLESYLTRWRIEETIRFIKQSYNLEDVRALKSLREVAEYDGAGIGGSPFCSGLFGQKAEA